MQRLPLTPTQFLVLLCLPLVIAFAFPAAKKAIDIHTLWERADALRDEIDALQVRNADLKRTIAYLKTDTFIEASAREQLNLIKPSETAYVVIVTDSPAAPTKAAPAAAIAPKSNPQKWWDFFFGAR